jgi:hypothetical protein
MFVPQLQQLYVQFLVPLVAVYVIVIIAYVVQDVALFHANVVLDV